MQKIEIPLRDAVRIFRLLEEAQDLFHQPLYYKDSAMVSRFAETHYPEIKDLYYNVVWNWLPDNLQQIVENDGSENLPEIG